MLITEAKEKGLIPKAWHNVFPDKCRCGEIYVISENLKTTSCPDPRCYIKVADRMADTLANLGIKGYGFSFCYKYVTHNQCRSHLDIFHKFGAEYMPNGRVDKTLVSEMYHTLKIKRTFAQAVALCEIPRLKNNAMKLFRRIDDFNHLREEVISRNSVLSFCQETFGPGETSVQATEVIGNFATELNVISKLFNLIPAVKKEFHIAITGSLDFFTRDEYIDFINNLGKGVIGVRVSKALSSVTYVIADSPSSSNTYLAGESRGIILTANEFANLVKEGVQLYE